MHLPVPTADCQVLLCADEKLLFEHFPKTTNKLEIYYLLGTYPFISGHQSCCAEPRATGRPEH